MSKSVADNLLIKLMNDGYTVNIQAKGRGREFEMSYEVMTLVKPGLVHFPLIAFGETLESALESLIRQIDRLNKGQGFILPGEEGMD